MSKRKPKTTRKTAALASTGTANAKKGTTTAFDPAHKIHLLVKENPKRKGSKEAKRFDKYRNGMTVQQAKEAGMDNTNFQRDTRLGFIRIGA